MKCVNFEQVFVYWAVLRSSCSVMSLVLSYISGDTVLFFSGSLQWSYLYFAGKSSSIQNKTKHWVVFLTRTIILISWFCSDHVRNLVFLFQYRNDFFLVSQHVRQGTVTPTHYVIVHDETGMQADHFQR